VNATGNQRPQLSKDQLERAADLQRRIEQLLGELGQLLNAPQGSGSGIDLRARGIDEKHASELRARLRPFAEDWDRPEAAIYDEDQTR
jgi:hypothetical protein